MISTKWTSSLKESGRIFNRDTQYKIMAETDSRASIRASQPLHCELDLAARAAIIRPRFAAFPLRNENTILTLLGRPGKV
jgi:hypothetical protein